MSHVRTDYKAGDRLIGGACPVERGPFTRRDQVQKGMFVIVDAPVVVKSAAPGLDEIRRRLDALGPKIAQVAAMVRDAKKRT